MEREKTGIKLMLEWKWKYQCEVMLFILGELGLSVRRAVASPEGDFEGDRAS